MSDIFYTNLDLTPGTDTKTKGFNLVGINTDLMYQHVALRGAQIAILPTVVTSQRTFDASQVFKIPNDVTIFDTDGFVDGTEGRLTIPSGFAYAEVWASLRYPVGNWRLSIYKNGSPYQDFEADKSSASLNSYNYGNVKTEMIAVTPGDYFEAYLFLNSTGTVAFDQIFKSGFSGSLVTEVSTPNSASLSLRALISTSSSVSFTL